MGEEWRVKGEEWRVKGWGWNVDIGVRDVGMRLRVRSVWE